MKFFFANGEITSIGTLGPKPWASICGGGTWSHQPPLESQITMITEFDQTGLACICLMKPSSHVMPLATGPLPGCILCAGAGCTYETAGRFPELKSVAKFEKSFTFGELCTSVKNWKGFSWGT